MVDKPFWNYWEFKMKVLDIERINILCAISKY